MENINDQIKTLKRTNRALLYKLEDQENRSRRKNLQVKGLPEKHGNEELLKVMQELFNPLLEREMTDIEN